MRSGDDVSSCESPLLLPCGVPIYFNMGWMAGYVCGGASERVVDYFFPGGAHKSKSPCGVKPGIIIKFVVF